MSTCNVHSYVCLSRCMWVGLAVVKVVGKGAKKVAEVTDREMGV